jgi:hypothetical protein
VVDKLIFLAALLWMFWIFAYTIYNPAMVIRWAKKAHPSISELDPEMRAVAKLVGWTGSIISAAMVAAFVASLLR